MSGNLNWCWRAFNWRGRNDAAGRTQHRDPDTDCRDWSVGAGVDAGARPFGRTPVTGGAARRESVLPVCAVREGSRTGRPIAQNEFDASQARAGDKERV